MKTRFKEGDKVIYNDQEFTVKTSTKNFSTGIVRYRLDSGELVDEGKLKAIKVQKTSELEELSAKYEAIYGKPVAPANKNNLEWIKKKIEEKKSEARENNEIPNLTWNDLKELEASDLLSMIESKNLDIDPDLYEDEDSLRQAVAEEMNVEITD